MFSKDEKLNGISGKIIEDKLQKLFEAIMVLKEESEQADNKLDRQQKNFEDLVTKRLACKHGPFKYKFESAFGPVLHSKTCEQCGLKMGLVTQREKIQEQLSFHESEASRLRDALHKHFPDKEGSQ